MIEIAVIDLGNEGVVDAISTILDLRMQNGIDLKYILKHIVESDTLILSSEPISEDIDINTLVSAIPSGTVRTLNTGELVTVYQIG